MLTLAAPALGMRTWPQDSSAQPSDLTTRKAYDLVAAEFGEAQRPGDVRRAGDRLDDAAADALARQVAARPDIAEVTPVVATADGALRIFAAEPAFGPTDAKTRPLVEELRARRPPASRSPARHHCSPTSPSCSPLASGLSSPSSWGSP